MPTYNPKAIEPRWQRFWLEHKTFRTPDNRPMRIVDKGEKVVKELFS